MGVLNRQNRNQGLSLRKPFTVYRTADGPATGYGLDFFAETSIGISTGAVIDFPFSGA